MSPGWNIGLRCAGAVVALLALPACPDYEHPEFHASSPMPSPSNVALTVRLPADRTATGNALLINGDPVAPLVGDQLITDRARLVARQGTAPTLLWGAGLGPIVLGGTDAPLSLLSVQPLGVPGTASPGGSISQGGVTVECQDGVLSRPARIAMGTYVISADAGAGVTEQQNDLVVGMSPCPSGAPYTCHLRASLGLVLAVDEAIGQGNLPVTIDLDTWKASQDSGRAALANALSAALAGLTPTQHQALMDGGLGVRNDGQRVTFTVSGIGSQGQLAHIQVDGFNALGVSLQFVVVSAAGPHLPAIAWPVDAPQEDASATAAVNAIR